MAKLTNQLRYLRSMTVSTLKIITTMQPSFMKLQIALMKLLIIMKDLILMSRKFQGCTWRQAKLGISLTIFKGKRIRSCTPGLDNITSL